MLSATLLSLSAVALLGLAMQRHWRQVSKKPLPTFVCRVLQVTGYVLLLLCLWRFSDGNQYQAGWVIGIAVMMLIAAGWSLSFSLWPRITAFSVLPVTVIGLLLL